MTTTIFKALAWLTCQEEVGMGKTLPHPSNVQVDVMFTEEKLMMLSRQHQYPQHGETLRIGRPPSSAPHPQKSWVPISTSFQHFVRGSVPKLYHYSPQSYF